VACLVYFQKKKVWKESTRLRDVGVAGNF